MILQHFGFLALALGGFTAALPNGVRHQSFDTHNHRASAEGDRSLYDKAFQSASTLTGQENGTHGIAAGQAKSATSTKNFINFCANNTLTNGRQLNSTSCNGIPMGRIPSASNMVSAIIIYPQPGDVVPADTPFDVWVRTAHLRNGHHVNVQTTYYSAPQDLDPATGDIVGHCHVVVQSIGSLRSRVPPRAEEFAFFKSVNDAGDGNGLLRVHLDRGLPSGAYRVCTMTAAQNHQPVVMPVAQRGPQDDCTKFEIVLAPGGRTGTP